MNFSMQFFLIESSLFLPPCQTDDLLHKRLCGCLPIRASMRSYKYHPYGLSCYKAIILLLRNSPEYIQALSLSVLRKMLPSHHKTCAMCLKRQDYKKKYQQVRKPELIDKLNMARIPGSAQIVDGDVVCDACVRKARRYQR